MSTLFGRTLREAPAEAETVNHQLALRAGLIVQLAAGVYSYLPLAWRAFRRIEDVIRDEMERAGAQELHLPAIQPLELWQETGRDQAYGPVLFRLLDRREREHVLAPTHEEAVTDLFRKTIQSYRELPQRVFQFQQKFRDEPRPRGGLIRVREFTMKDAYTFDVDDDAFQRSYDAMKDAYTRIFARCGVPAIPVEADSGAIGGKVSQEFIFLSEIGEDTICLCPTCGYAANQERAEFDRGRPPADAAAALEAVETPGVTTIADLARFLGIPEAATAKATFFLADGRPVFAVIRGDLDVNELKLQNALGARDLRPMTDAEVTEAGWVAGFASPVGLARPAGLRIVADVSVPHTPNLVAGANRPDTHLRNTNYGRDWEADLVADIGLAREGDPCPRECAGRLEMHRGIEVGHIFRLGAVYSEAMDARFTDAEGNRHAPIMGSYGIGLDRLLAAVLQANHDDAGIVWPPGVAPYDVHIVAIGLDKDEAVAAALDDVERALQDAGLRVLTDDRDERPGVKFNDADLLGLPVRLTVSARNLKAGAVEVKARTDAEATLVPHADLARVVQDTLRAAAERVAGGAAGRREP